MSVRQTLYFARPYHVEVRDEPIPPLAADQVLVKTVLSAISTGTELLFYRGQVPPEIPVDATFAEMDQPIHYPLSYGYCSVGVVVEIGEGVDRQWQNRRVFAFHPHSSAFVSDPAVLYPIPDGLSDEQAVFLPNMETAVNFLMDARPLIGERLLVLGLGVIGLLTIYLLRMYPVADVAAVDAYAKRKSIAHRWGVQTLFSPDEIENLRDYDPDLILELSSNPAALQSAINLAGFGTRIIVGSWYGDKIAHLPLGGKFHRNRVQLISSQVSTLDGQFSNRWSKSRRMQTAWTHLRALPTNELITHRMPVESASEAYQLLDQQPEQALQILLTY
jgi:2-desacetyl-2-hydroxyethyl bacteriochlorophyllide A dehydrogenase